MVLESKKTSFAATPHAMRTVVYMILGLLLIYAVVRSVFAAVARPLWFDELFTTTISAQGTWAGVIRALRVPVDSHPPFYYMLEHISSGLFANKEIAWRLPSIGAFPCTLLSVFLFLRKRIGEILALLCSFLLLNTLLFEYYAVEARSYSIVVACIAFAMVCYQRLSCPLWAVLFAISLALAESVHYLAVIAIAPFGIAEVVYSLQTRKLRWQAWTAFVVGLLPLIFFWKLLVLFKTYYGPGFYSRFFLFSSIPRLYGEFFLTDIKFGGALAAVAFAGMVGAAWQFRAKKIDPEQFSKGLAEIFLILGFVVLPFLGYFLLVRVAHGGFEGRYVISATTGIVIAMGFILSDARPRTTALFAAFVLSTVGLHELHFWRTVRGEIQNVRSIGPLTERLLQSAGHSDLPVVVPHNGFPLLPIIHYAPSVASRFVYMPYDHPAGEINWEDTVPKAMLSLQQFLPVRIKTFGLFTSEHRQFLIYTEKDSWVVNWLPDRLLRERWTVELVAAEGYRKLYLASANDGKPTATDRACQSLPMSSGPFVRRATVPGPRRSSGADIISQLIKLKD